ncbi:response regulator [Thermosulfuriphilus ammonigenes]|uniref:Response regulator n=1 Tax=Thermosulfuriphilus ammonigenes TaxID=1936021 RepID=A0A6G7PVY0_9BACT|nr:response regulator [Thermosulfuriphilus ammonigenes]MBA2848071.1 DNA-binding response OmpR family regulator [Thermosulfuriphilus ammonigenes]QIJ71747.1 response regulator [Thermosulfuriphilus ammonigenes]
MAIKVLVLDDEPEILESLRRLLELDGRFEPLVTTSPQEALSLVAREKIQIIICDIVMPEMDGLEFLERAHSINGLVQIIMMTAYSSVDRVLTCLEKGAADYLMKPFDIHEVRKVLDQVVQRLERWRELVIEARRREINPEEVARPTSGRQRGESPEERLEFLEELLAQRPPDLPFRLLEWLEEEDDQLVRERILEELGQRLAQEEDERLLKLMLSSPQAYIRNGAIDLAQDLGPQILPHLERLARDEDKDLRKLVLDIAVQINDPRAERLLLEALDDEETNVRITAAEYLGQKGVREAIPRLEEMAIREEDEMARGVALEALAALKESPRAREVISLLKEEASPVLLHSFLKYLARFGNKKDLGWLSKGIREGRVPLARESLEALVLLLKRHGQRPSKGLLAYLTQKAGDLSDSLEVYLLLQVVAMGDQQAASSLAGELLNGPIEVATGAINFLAEYGTSEDRQRLETLARESKRPEIQQTIEDVLEL